MAAPTVDLWLRDLGIETVERAEREGVTSWDLLLDGRRRFGIRTTLIVAPEIGAVIWIHYAPPLNDSFRKSYRQFLRWNDEFPFAKFALSAEERPVLTTEIPAAALDRDRLGVGFARLLAICDLLLDESAHWLSAPPEPSGAGTRASRHAHLLDRYATELGELAGTGGTDPLATLPAVPRPG